MHCANAHFLHDVITHMPRVLFCAFIRFNLNFNDVPLLENTPWLESIFACTFSNTIEFQCVSLVLKKTTFSAIHTTDRKTEKNKEQRTDSKKGEKTERIHKQKQKNKEDTYFRVIE